MQFLSQTGEIGLPPGKIGEKMAIGLILGGQNHIRRVKVFLRLGSSAAVKRTRLLGLKTGPW